VDIPGFAEDGDAFRSCGKQRADIRVVFHRDVLASCASECRELGMAQRVRAEQLKELHVLGVGAGVSGLDIIHAEVVEQTRNLQFVLHGKRNAYALRAVAQCGIQQQNFIHNRPSRFPVPPPAG